MEQLDTLPLIGRWTTDPTDRDTLRRFDNVTLEFRPDGSLICTVHGQRRDRHLLLRYRAEDGVLITEGPAAPRPEPARYSVTADGKLRLTEAGRTATYVREPLSRGPRWWPYR